MKKGGKGIQEEHEQDKENRALGGSHQQVMIRVSHDTGGAVQDEAGELIRPGKRGLQWRVEVVEGSTSSAEEKGCSDVCFRKCAPTAVWKVDVVVGTESCMNWLLHSCNADSE